MQQIAKVLLPGKTGAHWIDIPRGCEIVAVARGQLGINVWCRVFDDPGTEQVLLRVAEAYEPVPQTARYVGKVDNPHRFIFRL